MKIIYRDQPDELFGPALNNIDDEQGWWAAAGPSIARIGLGVSLLATALLSNAVAAQPQDEMVAPQSIAETDQFVWNAPPKAPSRFFILQGGGNGATAVSFVAEDDRPLDWLVPPVTVVQYAPPWSFDTPEVVSAPQIVDDQYLWPQPWQVAPKSPRFVVLQGGGVGANAPAPIDDDYFQQAYWLAIRPCQFTLHDAAEAVASNAPVIPFEEDWTSLVAPPPPVIRYPAPWAFDVQEVPGGTPPPPPVTGVHYIPQYRRRRR